mgnify:CR=1 FL=1
MFRLVFTSSATSEFDPVRFPELRAMGLNKNIRKDVKSSLMFIEGFFVEAMEGDEKTVRAVFASIKLSKLHHNIKVISEEHF